MLNQGNIEYLNFRDLGAPKELRDELYQSWNYSRFFRRYLRCIEDKLDLLEAIHALTNSGKKVTLLCYERNPEQCHRKVVAQQVILGWLATTFSTERYPTFEIQPALLS